MNDDALITASSTTLDVVGYDYLTPLLRLIFGSDGLFAGFTFDEIAAIAGVLWTIFVVCAYAISALFLFLYVYASMHMDELLEIEAKKIAAGEEAFKRQRTGGATATRFADMQAHVSSDNPNDWKLAIIEADIILDEALKRQGYAGTSLGERLRSVSPQALSTLDDAWEAHKIRNEIAHGGVDFVLTQKLARETVTRYERVFAEMGLL
jgi:hypothetical protein